MSDRDMINAPSKWPCWPFLPVKRLNNSLRDKNLGVLIDEGKKTRTIYHVYMFDLPPSMEGQPKTEYANTDKMLEEGWRVD